MQLDNLKNFKCNSCKNTDKIHEYMLFLKSKYKIIFKENYHLRQRSLEYEPEHGAPIKNKDEDLYQCKHCRFQSMKKLLFRNHTT